MSEAEVFATIGDVANEPVAQSGPTTDEDFVYVDIGSVDREAKAIADEKSLAASEAPSRAKQVLKAGDVLVSMTRPNLNAVAHVPATLDGAIGSTGFHVLRSQWMAPGFLYYLVQTTEFVDAMSSVVQGALYPAVRPADIAKFRFRLPPRAEQTRIVEKLEDLLGNLDAAVAELKAAQRKLARYRQSLLKAAVEGALTAEWRAANDKPREAGAELLQRILQERRARWEDKQRAKFAQAGKTPPKGWQAKYPEPVAPDTTDLPVLPDGWTWASAEQICEFITKGTTPPKGLDGKSEKSVPFLRVTNLTNTGALDFTDRVLVSANVHNGFLARSIVYPGDVLMNIVGPPLGQVSIVPADYPEWNINQAIAIFRTISGVLPNFIAACLLSNTAQAWLKRRAKTTAGQTNLTLELCRELPIPVPPCEEQAEILAILDTQLAAAKEQDAALTRALHQAAAQRRNLLKAAFAGQLVPQDPTDEPASELLARIRTERKDSDRGQRKRGPATRKTT